MLVWFAPRVTRPGSLAVIYLALQGSALLLEALRVDSLVTVGGIRAAQIVGLAMLLIALWQKRAQMGRAL